MIEHENGRVSGSIDRSRLVELLALTDDENLKAHYREQLGESAEGKAAAEEVGEQPAEDVEPAEEVDLDDLRAQAEGLGVKVDGRWGEQRLRDEIAAHEPEGDDKDEGEE